MLALLFYYLCCHHRHFLQLLNIIPYVYKIILPPLTTFNKAAYQANFLLPQHWRLYPDSKFHYTVIKATERQTEEIEELSESSFNSEESRAVERKIDCKVITYNKYNKRNEHNKNDKHNDNEYNESNKNQWLMSLMINSDTEDTLIQAVWRRNMRSTDLQISANV